MTKGTSGSVDAASAATSASFSNLFPGERYEVTVEAVSGTRMSSPETQQVVTCKSRTGIGHSLFIHVSNGCLSATETDCASIFFCFDNFRKQSYKNRKNLFLPSICKQ